MLPARVRRHCHGPWHGPERRTWLPVARSERTVSRTGHPLSPQVSAARQSQHARAGPRGKQATEIVGLGRPPLDDIGRHLRRHCRWRSRRYDSGALRRPSGGRVRKVLGAAFHRGSEAQKSADVRAVRPRALPQAPSCTRGTTAAGRAACGSAPGRLKLETRSLMPRSSPVSGLDLAHFMAAERRRPRLPARQLKWTMLQCRGGYRSA
jgi:hypothetical protein